MKTASRFCVALLLAGLAAPALAAPKTPPPKPAPAPAKPAATTSYTGSGPGATAIQAGALEVGGLLAWFKNDASDIGIAVINGGYMFTDQIEFHASWLALLGDASGGFITPAADYYFTNLQLPVIPYAGGGYAIAYGDAKDLSAIDLHVGVKQFLTERVALDYRLTYQEPTDSNFDASQVFLIGFSYYL